MQDSSGIPTHRSANNPAPVFPSAPQASPSPFDSRYTASYRPRMPDQRPHTVHASPAAFNLIAEEGEDHEDGEASDDSDRTPRASAAGLFGGVARGESSRRRMSRDDTANDLHLLAELPDANTMKLWEGVAPEDTTTDHQRWEQAMKARRTRKPLYRLPPNSASASMVADQSSSEGAAAKSSNSLGRRLSRSYKERVNELRESMRYAIPSGRSRRSSTPHRLEFAAQDAMAVDHVADRPPTSPSKRSARQTDERPRKHRSFLPLGDRKDTPAPAAFGLPVRPASSRVFTPTISAAPGGEAARKAAALYNHHVIPPSCQPNAGWDNADDNDIHTRRGRLGSLSSAADSGADLSTYSGSEHGGYDMEGDTPMQDDSTMHETDEDSGPPASRDFTTRLPDELSSLIFQQLEGPDLVRAEMVCHRWKALAGDSTVWRHVFLRRYQRRIITDPAPIQVGGEGIGRVQTELGKKGERISKPTQEWRKMYKARVQIEQNWRAGAQDAGKAIYLSGHTDSVYCLQFDEEKIITGSRDRTIRVWDINTYQCIRVIGGPDVKPTLGPKVLRTVDYPAFHMATASVNGTAYGDQIYHSPKDCHNASILCLQYDEKILVTGSSDSDLIVWDIKTYEPIRRLKRHTGGVLDVALDADHIVSCSKDSRIIVWDRKTFEPKGELTGHRGPVNAVQLRGSKLVSASGDGIARLWDLKTMKLQKEFSAKERGLAAVEFSEDMKYVLAGGNDNITYKFETDTGDEVMQFTGHTQLVRSLWLDSANDRVVSGSYDLDLRVYDFVTGEELWRGEEWTTSWMLAAKSDYRRIVATSQDGRILIVDFGIYKGAPRYESRDGMPVENLDLLRGIEHTNEIRFRNPFEDSRRRTLGPN